MERTLISHQDFLVGPWQSGDRVVCDPQPYYFPKVFSPFFKDLDLAGGFLVKPDTNDVIGFMVLG